MTLRSRAAADAAILDLNRRRMCVGASEPVGVQYSTRAIKSLLATQPDVRAATERASSLLLTRLPPTWTAEEVTEAIQHLNVVRPDQLGDIVSTKRGSWTVHLTSPEAARALLASMEHEGGRRASTTPPPRLHGGGLEGEAATTTTRATTTTTDGADAGEVDPPPTHRDHARTHTSTDPRSTGTLLGPVVRASLYSDDLLTLRAQKMADLNPERRAVWVKYVTRHEHDERHDEPSTSTSTSSTTRGAQATPTKFDLNAFVSWAQTCGRVQAVAMSEDAYGVVAGHTLFADAVGADAFLAALARGGPDLERVCRPLEGRVASRTVESRTRRVVARIPPPGVPPTALCLAVSDGLPPAVSRRSDHDHAKDTNNHASSWDVSDARRVVEEALRKYPGKWYRVDAVPGPKGKVGMARVFAWGEVGAVEAAVAGLGGKDVLGLGAWRVRKSHVLGVWEQRLRGGSRRLERGEREMKKTE